MVHVLKCYFTKTINLFYLKSNSINVQFFFLSNYKFTYFLHEKFVTMRNLLNCLIRVCTIFHKT